MFPKTKTVSPSAKKHRAAIICLKDEHEFRNTIGAYTSHINDLCPGCRIETAFDSSQFESEMEKADQPIPDSSKSISRKFG